MQLSLIGIGSDTLLTDFDSAGIEFIKINPKVGTVLGAGGNIQLLNDISGAVPWASIAAVIIAWLKYRPSRMVTVTTKEQNIINIEGYSTKDVEALLPICHNIIIAETKKPTERLP